MKCPDCGTLLSPVNCSYPHYYHCSGCGGRWAQFGRRDPLERRRLGIARGCLCPRCGRCDTEDIGLCIYCGKGFCNHCGSLPEGVCDRCAPFVATGDYRYIRFDENEHCQDCERPYAMIWEAPNDLWRELVGPNGAGLLCPDCFDKRAAAAGKKLSWRCVVDCAPPAVGDS